MKWMKERDLLIAQTMAFVQSVTGKTPEAEKTVSAPVSRPSVEASETTRPATALYDKALSDIASLLALSVGTIHTYRARLLHKLAMNDTGQAVGSAFA